VRNRRKSGNVIVIRKRVYLKPLSLISNLRIFVEWRGIYRKRLQSNHDVWCDYVSFDMDDTTVLS
jgi:hypothetical protein